MSFLLTCPNCGAREVTDFGYGGEVPARPAQPPASLRELAAVTYLRRNVAGVQREWWVHRAGCKAWFLAERDTRTNGVLWTALPSGAPASAPLAAPASAAPGAPPAPPGAPPTGEGAA